MTCICCGGVISINRNSLTCSEKCHTRKNWDYRVIKQIKKIAQNPIVQAVDLGWLKYSQQHKNVVMAGLIGDPLD